MNKVYQIVTEKIIDYLQQGIIPWERPFIMGDSAPRGYDMAPGESYRGINRLLCPLPGEYLTRKSIMQHNGRIINPDKYYIITFCKRITSLRDEDVEQEGETMTADNEVKYVFRYFKVYHISNVEGVASKCSPRREADRRRSATAEFVFTGYMSRAALSLRHTTDRSLPNYVPGSGEILLPSPNVYRNDESYYSDLFHQVVASVITQENEKCDADGVRTEYSTTLINLVSEIGSAMLMNHCGLDSGKIVRNNAAYIQRVIMDLNAHPAIVVSAARKAEQAVNTILGVHGAVQSECGDISDTMQRSIIAA